MNPVSALDAATTTDHAYRFALRRHRGVKVVVTMTYLGDHSMRESYTLTPDIEGFDEMVIANHPSWIDYFESAQVPIGTRVVQTIGPGDQMSWTVS